MGAACDLAKELLEELPAEQAAEVFADLTDDEERDLPEHRAEDAERRRRRRRIDELEELGFDPDNLEDMDPDDFDWLVETTHW